MYYIKRVSFILMTILVVIMNDTLIGGSIKFMHFLATGTTNYGADTIALNLVIALFAMALYFLIVYAMVNKCADYIGDLLGQ